MQKAIYTLTPQRTAPPRRYEQNAPCTLVIPRLITDKSHPAFGQVCVCVCVCVCHHNRANRLKMGLYAARPLAAGAFVVCCAAALSHSLAMFVSSIRTTAAELCPS